MPAPSAVLYSYTVYINMFHAITIDAHIEISVSVPWVLTNDGRTILQPLLDLASVDTVLTNSLNAVIMALFYLISTKTT